MSFVVWLDDRRFVPSFLPPYLPLTPTDAAAGPFLLSSPRRSYATKMLRPTARPTDRPTDARKKPSSHRPRSQDDLFCPRRGSFEWMEDNSLFLRCPPGGKNLPNSNMGRDQKKSRPTYFFLLLLAFCPWPSGAAGQLPYTERAWNAFSKGGRGRDRPNRDSKSVVAVLPQKVKNWTRRRSRHDLLSNASRKSVVMKCSEYGLLHSTTIRRISQTDRTI